MFKKYILPLFISFLLVFLTTSIGSYFTTPNIVSWYQYLKKPSFAPPNWLFGPAWILFYFLMAVAAFLVWRERENKNIKSALSIYLIHLIFNALWSIIFFGLKNFGFAFFEIVILWILILLTIIKFYKIKPLAAFLLIPYILWVTFASILNLAVWMLN
ncbi:MAG: tryptophan-rich sensory protein [Patescibacteria group bacterium]|nr:tryptophan-rich sensory protein [Patescibacteria group bacterium]